MRVNFACIIATQGRNTLERSLRSVLSQDLRPGDRLILVIDERERPANAWYYESPAARLLLEQRSPLRIESYFHRNDRCTYSHEQAAYGVSLAPDGHWLTLLGDDDVYTPGAWAAMRAAAGAGQPRPLLFRMDHQAGGIIWSVKGRVEEGRISEQCLIAPKLPGLVGHWDFNRYAGDFEWVRSTLALWAARGIDPEWNETIIQFARPAERGYTDDV